MISKDKYTRTIRWMVAILFILQLIFMMNVQWYGREEKSSDYQGGSPITRAEVATLYSRDNMLEYVVFSITTPNLNPDYWATKQIAFWEAQKGEKIENPDEIADLEMVQKLYSKANSVRRVELYDIRTNRMLLLIIITLTISILLTLILPKKVGFIINILMINLLAYASMSIVVKIGLILTDVFIWLWIRKKNAIIKPQFKISMILSIMFSFIIYGLMFTFINGGEVIMSVLFSIIGVFAYLANLVMIKNNIKIRREGNH